MFEILERPEELELGQQQVDSMQEHSMVEELDILALASRAEVHNKGQA